MPLPSWLRRMLAGGGSSRRAPVASTGQPGVSTADETLLAALTAGRTVAWEWDLRSDRVVRTANAPALLGLPVVNEAGHGQSFERMIHPDDREHVRRAVQSALAAGTPVASEFRVVRPDGSVLWVLDDGQFEVDGSGRPLRMRGILRDITEQKVLEAKLEQAHREAEAANQAKDQFLATLSHELRTPLNAILGWASILRGSGLGEAELRQGLEVIERNARIQTQLIDDLLDMSRIISGKMRLDIQPVDPVSFIGAAIDTVRPAAEAKGIRLTSLLDPGTGPITGDPNRLQQVVWNLLSNAVKFTGKNGRVQVLLERVNSHIEITVADTGVGISAESLPHVFDRFHQGDVSPTRVTSGLGLGLAIVKHLVELHGGTVSVSSAGEGQGATFTIALPLTVVQRDAEPSERLHPRGLTPVASAFRRVDLSGVKVLVVDDQVDALELIKRVLEECDAEVLAAGSADEALRALQAAAPHVLVTDIGMPDVDGYELLRRVRAMEPARGGRLPAIALTAFARSEDRTRALRAGFLAHVAKPVEPTELVATVASVVGRAGDSVEDPLT